MKLALRVLLPAALVAAALAIPTSGTADPPATGACPDGFLGPFPIAFLAPQKDKNNDGLLCVKQNRMQLVFKDDNCNPNCDGDDIIITLDPALLPEDTFEDTLP